MPEYVLNGILFVVYMVFFDFFGVSKWCWYGLLVQAVAMYVYAKYISILEENIIEVMQHNYRIPNVIWGYFNSLPRQVTVITKNDNNKSISSSSIEAD